jgi:hypothetical protein
MDEIIEVGKALWVVVEDAPFAFDGLFHLRDDTGGDVLIDVEEIPKLMEALQKVQERRMSDEL